MYLHYIYIYIYLHTLHAHLHTTPADTVHTPHTDEWLAASKMVSIVFGLKKVVILSFYLEVLLFSKCENQHFGCFLFQST